MSKVLITGITGFAGSWLADYLLIEGQDVYGTSRWRSKTDNIDHIKKDLRLVNADIRDGYSLQKAFKEIQPDYCFHLAAQSFVLESWNSPLETLGTNVLGTTNVLEAIRHECPGCKTLVAGSSEEYGKVYSNEIPITENNPLRPMSPYGVSKVATDKLGILYYMSYGLHIVVTRAFNHTGPRRGEVFVTSSFAKQVAEIEKEGGSVIKVGNLSSFRDFTDVRDMVKAYWLLARKGLPGEVYNICSGKGTQIAEVLNILLGLSDSRIRVEQDPSRMRPSDVPLLVGDCSKLKTLTGWRPERPFKETLEDLLNYWRSRV